MILISGASRGIGKYIMERYVELGKEDIIGIYNRTKPTEHLDKYVRLDVTDEVAIEEFFKSNNKRLDRIKFINFAGANHNSRIQNFSSERWKEVMNVNLNASFYLIKNLFPLMKEQQYGRIVLCASVVSQIGVIGTAAYASSKAGLWGLTRDVAKEGASSNITANCLNLGYFNVGMISEIPEDKLKTIIDSIPVRRLGDPIDIFYALNFLFNSSYTTGSRIDINGGLY